MPRTLSVVPHLPVDELARRYRQSREPITRSHWQMLWLVAGGRPATEVAPLVGYSVSWVRTIVHRYNAEGPAGVGDRRQHNPGQPPLLSPADRDALRAALAGPAPDGGLWTGPKVAAWMAERLGRPVGKPRGWEALRALGMTLQHPRPRATSADPAQQEAFKKGGSKPPSMR